MEETSVSIELRMKERLETFLKTVRTEMENAGRNPAELTVIGVSKFFPADYARAAVKLGVCHLGENRVTELLSKKEELERDGFYPEWHLIGTLQTNKVKKIIGNVSLIHSVDSARLLSEISDRSMSAGTVTDVLLQINISQEQSKHGFTKTDPETILRHSADYPGVAVRGLMTMAPIVPCAYTPRMVFEELRELFERTRKIVDRPELWTILSMGMSQDYIEAIRFGATHIRIGTAIFGPRT